MKYIDIQRILVDIADRKSSNFDLNLLLESNIKNLDSLKEEVSEQYHDILDQIGDFNVVEVNDPDDATSYSEVRVWRIFYFKKIDIYIKVDGWNGSYSGYQFESMKEVKPITKTITTYE
jgi:hypothetical protein